MRIRGTLALAFAAIAALPVAANAQLSVSTFASGFTNPLAMTQDPGNPNVQYVVERGGVIKVIENGAVKATPFLDISGQVSTVSEQGLLGLEFAPDYATSGLMYVNYTDLSGDTHIARFQRSISDPLQADPASEFTVMVIDQPFENHNGGTIRFGDDGFLYIGMGDGGGGFDPQGNAQDPNSLLGKMLRIDPSADAFPGDPNANYSIPGDNPFLDNTPIPARGEIWSFGLRNPFKWSFDSVSRGGTGAMIIGDVGQDNWEEIDYEAMGDGGHNYGWVVREGAHDTGVGSAAYTPLTDPIFELDHTAARSITGGYVYRGTGLGAGYEGRYFFADFVFGKLFSFNLSGGVASDFMEHTAEVGGGLGNIASVDIDSNGELYLVDFSGGRVLQVVPEPGTMAALGIGALALLARRRRKQA